MLSESEEKRIRTWRSTGVYSLDATRDIGLLLYEIDFLRALETKPSFFSEEKETKLWKISLTALFLMILEDALLMGLVLLIS